MVKMIYKWNYEIRLRVNRVNKTWSADAWYQNNKNYALTSSKIKYNKFYKPCHIHSDIITYDFIPSFKSLSLVRLQIAYIFHLNSIWELEWPSGRCVPLYPTRWTVFLDNILLNQRLADLNFVNIQKKVFRVALKTGVLTTPLPVET